MNQGYFFSFKSNFTPKKQIIKEVNKLRTNYEAKMLKQFTEIAEKHGKTVYKKQVKNNRIKLRDNNYFQYGDLRVKMKNYDVIVEVESSGSIINLAKYWYCLETQKITRPIILLHVYRQSTPNDYKSRLDVWDFLWNKIDQAMNENLENEDFRILAKKYAYNEEKDIKIALDDFEKCLEGKIAHMRI